MVAAVCAAAIGVGGLLAVADALTPVPLLPVAASSVALGAAGLAVRLRRSRWLLLTVALIGCAALAVDGDYLFDDGLCAAAALVALTLLALAGGCVPRAWPETGRLLAQTRARSVISSQEHHAARIAGEIHDEVLQALALLSRRLHTAAAREPGPSAPVLREAVTVLDEQATVLRGIVRTLHPVLLDHLGLLPAIRLLADQVAAGNGLVIEVRETGCPVPGDTMDPEVATAVYRIVQEALMNVVKHAEAATVLVELCGHPGELVLTIADDGRGLPATDHPTGYGSEGMRWRCTAYGGTFTVDSRPGGGTRVRAGLPVTTAARSRSARGTRVSRPAR